MVTLLTLHNVFLNFHSRLKHKLHLHSKIAELCLVQTSLHVRFFILLLVDGDTSSSEQFSITCLHH